MEVFLASPNCGSQARGEAMIEAKRLLKTALDKARIGGRNDTGFWLACQLSDSGHTQEAAACRYEDESQ